MTNIQLLNPLTRKELLDRLLLQWDELPTYFLQLAHILPCHGISQRMRERQMHAICKEAHFSCYRESTGQIAVNLKTSQFC